MPRGKLSQDLGRLDPAGPRYATEVVEHVLVDLFLEVEADFAEGPDDDVGANAAILRNVAAGIDGVLQPVAVLPSRLAANVVARLKVLAELLTYRTDVVPGGANPGSSRRGRDAALHVSHAAWREGRGASLRRDGPVPPPCRSGAARRGA